MASYFELLTAEQNPDLNNRVRVAIVIAAENIRRETAGANLANRKIWAKQALADPFSKAKQMLWAVLAKTQVDTPLVTLAAITGALDDTVQTAVNAAVDVFATGS